MSGQDEEDNLNPNFNPNSSVGYYKGGHHYHINDPQKLGATKSGLAAVNLAMGRDNPPDLFLNPNNTGPATAQSPRGISISQRSMKPSTAANLQRLIDHRITCISSGESIPKLTTICKKDIFVSWKTVKNYLPELCLRWRESEYDVPENIIMKLNNIQTGQLRAKTNHPL